MHRVDIVVPRSLSGAALRAVHRAGLVHLTPYAPPAGVGPAVFGHDPTVAQADRFDAAREHLAELDELLGSATPDPAGVAEVWDRSDDEMLSRVAALEPARQRAAALTAERLRATGEIARLDGYQRIIEGLSEVVGQLPAVRGYSSTGIVVAARYRSVVELLRDELESLTEGRCEVVAADLGGDRVAAILLYPTRLADEVRTLLGGRDLEEVTLPDELAGVPFGELEPRLAAERARLAGLRTDADRALADLRTSVGPTIACLRTVVADRVAEIRALDDAAASDHLVVLSGWLPARSVAALRDVLEREVGPAVAVLERGTEDRRDEAPVAMEHGRFVRAFAPIASFVSLPRYGTLDPTPLLALTLPAFVGLMVGDIGYGLVLLGLLVLVRRRWRGAAWMTVVWPVGLAAAASTIAFGFLFGELFGDAGHTILGLEPLWIDRAEAVELLLVLALAIGLGQVGLGLILGVVNAALLHRGREVASRVALVVSVTAILALLAVAARLVPAEIVPLAALALVVSLIVLGATVGLAGPIEVVGVLGNILSYARLMAIGLASVMLALVANRLGGLVENAVLGVVVAGAVHALNIGLGFFDASIQGLRLHYIEFFGRFVEPGGIRYEPFVSALGAGAGPAARSATLEGGPGHG
jgi:V/A-type H+-transporting ATPase subunit I